MTISLYIIKPTYTNIGHKFILEILYRDEPYISFNNNIVDTFDAKNFQRFRSFNKDYYNVYYFTINEEPVGLQQNLYNALHYKIKKEIPEELL